MTIDMRENKVSSKVRSVARSLREYYDWRRRTVLTTLYFWYTGNSVIQTTTPAGEIELEVASGWGRAYDYATGKMYEPVLQRGLYEVLSEDTVFYNIGARWGIFSVFAEKCGVEPSNIHNFEADSDTFEILKRNVSSQHVSNNVFVSDSDADKAITLDSYASTHTNPTVIKMDIEGGELAALRGATAVLDQAMPTLFIEVHPEYIEQIGGTHHELIEMLTTRGYDLKIARNDPSTSTFEPIDEQSPPSNPKHGTYRLLAIETR